MSSELISRRSTGRRPAIRIQGLAKRYRTGGSGPSYRTLRESLYEALRVPRAALRVQRATCNVQRGARNEFWALRDIDLEVQPGEVLGVIGRNGAGKSTLLKILSRITQPTHGRIEVRGRIGSLLEVGTGFHPELSGRENIYLNGVILGLSRREIDRQFDAIVAFSGVESFLETPVKRYSSGMYVRLAFAVAAHLTSDILIVDEVLAVGDMEFQRRCLGKMQDVAGQGKTVLFVSHNMGLIQTLCHRGLLLQAGSVHVDGSINEAVSEYLRTVEQRADVDLERRVDRGGAGAVRLTRVEIDRGEGTPNGTLATGQPARFVFHVSEPAPQLSCAFSVYDEHGRQVAHFNSQVAGPEDLRDPFPGTRILCAIDEWLLTPGRYRINAALMTSREVQDHVEAAAVLHVEQGSLRGRPVGAGIGTTCVSLPHRWSLPGSV